MKLNITIEIDDAEIARLLGREQSAVETPDDLKLLPLVVGGTYRNRRGEETTLLGYDSSDSTYCGSCAGWYEDSGELLGYETTDDSTLVARIA